MQCYFYYPLSPVKVIQTNFKVEGYDLNEAKLATGYPQRLSAFLTAKGYKMVEEEGFMIYHSSEASEVTVDSETILDRQIGVPGFSIQADAEGSFVVQSKLRDDVVDQISLTFVKPDEISVLSWIREPLGNEFTEQSGEDISVSVGSQAAFIPIPKFEGERIIGDIEVELSIDPPDAAAIGYNIESISEDGVEASSNPPSLYFTQEGSVDVCATDIVNDVMSCQSFTVR